MYIFVYITASNIDEAKKISKSLLEKKLAACVNIFPITSFFWWEGKIDESEEVAMIVKTKADRFKELKDEVLSLHSYTTPCICTIPIEEGFRKFLDWIDEVLGE
ncbi:divalent-cation tolerance protein CutA [Archaeoglobales archaeon]|nr:MAG: divalent-cation tolerance protein CutA [Archaeoglobales archaeon]